MRPSKSLHWGSNGAVAGMQQRLASDGDESTNRSRYIPSSLSSSYRSMSLGQGHEKIAQVKPQAVELFENKAAQRWKDTICWR